MIGLSPKGVLDATVVFPIMFVIALVLDILNIILSLTIVGGIILALIGFFTVGLWIIIRSGGERSGSKEAKKEGEPTPQGETGMVAKEGEETAAREGGVVATREGETVAAREGAEVAAKRGATVAAREGAEVAAKTAAKSALTVSLRIGTVTILKAVPLVGMISSVVFGWTVMVLWELFSDLKNSSPEAGD